MRYRNQLALSIIAAAALASAAHAQRPAEHWAFKAPQRPALPQVRDAAWPSTPIDHFILARLEAAGLQPATPADRRTLIRRASYDLIGLPPTYEQVARFEADPSPDAYERIVDELLASPAYGERWGRHWLDIARYANTVGDTPGRDPIAPYNYSYRDYVIEAFNRDLPYDHFIHEQIAADLLDRGGDNRSLAALGFITVGRRFLNNIHDTLDDRIDVVTRGFMALTVQCARCHDHKYDPITIEDYYGLYGIFANSVEPGELPVIDGPRDEAAYQQYLAERAQREEKVEEFRAARHREILADYRGRAGDYLLATAQIGREMDEESVRAILARKLHPLGVNRWREALEAMDLASHPIFAPWAAFAALSQEDFAEQAAVQASRFTAAADPQRPLNRYVVQAFADPPPSSLQEVAERYGKLFAEAAEPREDEAPPDVDREALRLVLHGEDAPGNLNETLLERMLIGTPRNQLQQLAAEVLKVDASHPGAPARAVVLADNTTITEPRVFVRGDPRQPGGQVPRRFLTILAGTDAAPFTIGSGRLELARAIAAPDNPLTARVLVNRVWMHHFGAPLVATPDDFGLRSEPPTHPQLLDYLATTFIDGGWSIKKLHRAILLSATYRQSSGTGVPPLVGRDVRPTLDPDNQLLSRMNRRRLDFEAMRDTLLAISQRLDRSFGGKPVVLTEEPYPQRRTIYGFIDRQSLPDLLRIFDFADPDTCTARRYNTSVPQQGLFFLNSPFVIEQAKALAARIGEAPAEDAARVMLAYRAAFGRDPAPRELELGLQFVSDGQPGVWERYAMVLLQANELVFID